MGEYTFSKKIFIQAKNFSQISWITYKPISSTLFALGRSLLIPCSSSDARMLLFNANFIACKLIIDWKFYKKE